MKPKVAILLSTYNGEKYLRAQLNTILSQEDVDITVFVRDDGSQDGTVNILQEFEQNRGVNVDYASNVGWRRSFMDLICKVSEGFDFYAFADQDDEWEADKLKRATKKMEETDSVVYFSNLNLFDTDMNFVGTQFSDDYRPLEKFETAFFEGVGTGATLAFDQRLLKKIKEYRPNQLLAHDAYVVALARLLYPNQVFYDKVSKIRYRRHDNNATGFSGEFKPGKVSLAQRYKRYKKNNFKPFSNRAAALIAGYSNQMSDVHYRYLSLIASANDNLSSRLRILFSPKFSTRGVRKTLQIKFRAIARSL